VLGLIKWHHYFFSSFYRVEICYDVAQSLIRFTLMIILLYIIKQRKLNNKLKHCLEIIVFKLSFGHRLKLYLLFQQAIIPILHSISNQSKNRRSWSAVGYQFQRQQSKKHNAVLLSLHPCLHNKESSKLPT